MSGTLLGNGNNIIVSIITGVELFTINSVGGMRRY